ncbi:hypothetical protein PIB30_032788 [Stylosanthes scabra]|uniref:Uncharacterized protein n=1 Tax=Stylosanthes scabra TaxID=79078 RepID=A0ABU6WAA6_9FABA|nr:hypothetical protein [Stylosanthes scabra]
MTSFEIERRLTRRRYWRRRHPHGDGNKAGASSKEDVDGVGAIMVKAQEQMAPLTWQALAV